MTMKLGELVGFIDLTDKGFGKGLDQAGQGLNRLQSVASRSLQSVEQEAIQNLNRVASELGDAFDPAAALADADRLVSGFARDMDRMEAEASRGGHGVVEQLQRALDDAEQLARRSGEDAGRGFSDEVEGAGKSRMGGVGEKLIGSLKGLGWAAAGAAIGAVLMKGLESALDLDAARAKLKAQVGDPALVAEIGKAAGRVYGRGFTETLDEATEAARAVLSTGLVPKGDAAALEDLTVKAQAYAKAWGDDVAESIQHASTLVGSGLAKNATHAFDLITEASRRVPTALREDVLEAGDEYAQFFRALGFSGEQAFGLLTKAAEKGQYGIDKTGDAIKEFTLLATTMNSSTKEAYKAIGLNAEKMSNDLLKGGDTAHAAFQKIVDGLRSIKDPTEQANTAIALFGTPLEDMNKADIPAFLANLDKVGSGLGDVSGKAKGAGDALENSASQKVQAFKNSLEQGVVNFIGDKVLPALDSLAKNVDLSGLQEKAGPALDELKRLFDDVFGDISDWFDKNKDKIDEWKEKLGGAIDDAKAILSDIREFWGEWGGTITDTAGMIVDGVVSMFTGGWSLVRGIWDTAIGFITGDWEKFKSGILSIGSGLWDTLNGMTFGALNKFKDGISSNLSAAGKYFSELKDKVLAAVKGAAKWLAATGKDIVTGLWSGIQSLKGWIQGKVTSFFGGLVPDWVKNALDSHSPSKVFETIGTWVVQGFIRGIFKEQPKAQMTAQQFAKLVKDAFAVKLGPNAPDALVEWVKAKNKELHDLADKRAEIMKTIADAKKYAADIAKQMQDFASVADLGLGDGADAGDVITGLQNKLNAIKKFAADIQKLAKMGLNKTTLRQIIEAGPDKGLALAEMLVGADGSEIKAINKAQKQIDKVSKQMGKNSADALYDVGKQAGQGFLKGLQGQLKEVESMMAKIAKAVVAAAKKELGVKSPSRVLMGIGDNTMAGFILGVLGKQGATVAAMSQVVGKAVSAAAAVTPPAGVTPQPMAGPTGAPAYGGAYGQAVPPASGGVIVNMYDPVVREEADIGRLGAQFGFEYRARG